MQTFKLGNSSLHVSRLGLGCMGMSEFYGPKDDAESIKTLHGALDCGVNFLDTADLYGTGHNESLLGQALVGKRAQVVLATKFGFIRDAQGGIAGIDGSPAHLKQACENSLRRLRTDVIDLYYAHRVDPQVPIEDTVGAMADLVQAGKVRFLGLSEAPPEVLRRASKVHPIAALQSEYSLWSRDPEGEVLATCRELGIALVAYSPLGRGFLTGAIASRDALDPSDYRLRMPRFQADTLAQNADFLGLINSVGAQRAITPAQVALAWVLHQGADIFAIPGTRKLARLKENLAALAVQFSADELAAIRARLPVTAGARY